MKSRVGVGFQDNIIWKLGNELNIKFHEDCWMRNKSLRDGFQRLCFVSTCKEVWLYEVERWKIMVVGVEEEFFWLEVQLNQLKKLLRGMPLMMEKMNGNGRKGTHCCIQLKRDITYYLIK